MDAILIILSVITVIALLSLIYKDMTITKLNKQHAEERRDLMNRLMAKNLPEYQSINDNTLPKGNNHLKEQFEGLYE